MKKYHKINSLFKRDAKGNFILGEFSTPEFEYLFENEWIGTEKIDGTNIRIHWDGQNVKIGGRTDNAQIPSFLLERLNYLVERFNWISAFDDPVVHGTEGNPIVDITLYGEGYGAKIQKSGGLYIRDGVDFILFDVRIGSWWLKRQDVDEIANKLRIDSVPVVFRGTLPEAIEFIKPGFDSTIGEAKSEGLVLVPAVDLFTRRGDRVITKLKTKDFL